MALRRKRPMKRRPRRRVRRTRRGRKSRTVTRVARCMPVSDKLLTCLTYAQTYKVTLSQTNTLVLQGTWVTSAHNPQGMGVGHQPLWWDQFQQMYSRYRVYGIKYVINVQNDGLVDGWYAGVRHQNTTVAENNLFTLMERNDARVKLGGAVGGSNARLTFKGYMSVAKTLGADKKDVSTSDDYEASWTSDPVRKAYLMLYLQAYQGGPQWTVNCRLEYMCELSGRVSPGQS